MRVETITKTEAQKRWAERLPIVVSQEPIGDTAATLVVADDQRPMGWRELVDISADSRRPGRVFFAAPVTMPSTVPGRVDLDARLPRVAPAAVRERRGQCDRGGHAPRTYNPVQFGTYCGCGMVWYQGNWSAVPMASSTRVLEIDARDVKAADMVRRADQLDGAWFYVRERSAWKRNGDGFQRLTLTSASAGLLVLAPTDQVKVIR